MILLLLKPETMQECSRTTPKVRNLVTSRQLRQPPLRFHPGHTTTVALTATRVYFDRRDTNYAEEWYDV